jgi:coenzyme F420-reducing hydrogenase gamma subunit
MDDFEWIEKEELVEDLPKDVATQPSKLCQDGEGVSDSSVPTEEEHVAAIAEDVPTDKAIEGYPPDEVTVLRRLMLQMLVFRVKGFWLPTSLLGSHGVCCTCCAPDKIRRS